MDNRQKTRRSEDGPQRLPGLPAAAEAVVMGTIASGLVVGAAHAKQAQIIPEEDAAARAADPLPFLEAQTDRSVEPQATVQAAMQAPAAGETAPDKLPGAGSAVPDQHSVNEPDASPVFATYDANSQLTPPQPNDTAPSKLAPEATAAQVHSQAHPGAMSVAESSINAPLPPFDNPIVERLAEQITASVSQALDTISLGLPAAEIGTSVAHGIAQAAAQLVAELAPVQTGLDQALSDIPLALEPIAELPATVDGLVGSLIAETETSLAGGLAALPSSLLGNEGSDLAGGLLSDLFYSDGQPTITSLPSSTDLALTALPTMDGISQDIGFLATSYLDLQDGGLSGHGLNALSLL